MKQRRRILFFCMIFVAKISYGQQYTQFYRYLPDNKRFFFNLSVFPQQENLNIILPANFYCTQLGFFCQKEIQIESAIKIPFKFRLGNVQYCDWLEGKRSAGILP